jgi:5-methylthioadenosine/S-adenosylhomocysteine deaminase
MARQEKGKTIIRGALVAQPDAARAEPADILVIDGTLAQIGSPGFAAPLDATELDARNTLIHPGLINAHTHGAQLWGRSRTDRMTLETLLAAGPWANRDKTAEDKHLAALVCAAEMVLKGCTAAYDLYAELPLPTRDGMDSVAAAYSEIGMRAVIAPQVSDISFFEAIPGLMDALPPDLRAVVPQARPGPPDACLAALDDILRSWRWSSDDIHVALGPTIPHHCTENFICGCAKLARNFGARLHTHVSESKVQAIVGRRLYGDTLTRQLDRWGVLGPDFTAAHAVWLTDDDMKLMADRGASVAHNAGSNMSLGNGMFPLRRMIDAGVNVAIGSDGNSCSDNQNIYESMRYASMMAKVQTQHMERWATSAEIYRAATVGGARALGLERVGEIRKGYRADLVVLDLTRPTWMPHNSTVTQIVQAEDGTSVRHVMIGGRMVVRDRELLTVDLVALSRKVEAARQRFDEALGPSRDLLGRLSEAVDRYCSSVADEPYSVRRYLCEAELP